MSSCCPQNDITKVVSFQHLLVLFVIAHRYDGYSLGNTNPGNGTIWLEEVSCRGTETDIASCSHKSWGHHDCDHSEDVSVRCTEPTTTGIKELSHVSK